jgi:hypothetical protein
LCILIVFIVEAIYPKMALINIWRFGEVSKY